MKRLYELLDDIDDEILMKNIQENYDKDIYDHHGIFQDIKVGIENLKLVIPKMNNNVICCIYIDNCDIDFSKEPFYSFEKIDNCFYLYHENLIKYQHNSDEVPERYATDMLEWNELLGSYVFIETDDVHTFEYGLASVIEEVMFFGNTQEDRHKKIEEMNKKIKEFDKDKDTSKYYTAEEFFDRMIKLIEKTSKDEAKRIREHHRLYDVHQEEIHAMNIKMMKDNEEHFKRICSHILAHDI